MAKRNNKGQFLPGESPNPAGGPKIPQELKELRVLNRVEVEQLINDYWMLPESVINQKFNHPDTPLRDKLVIRVILRGIAKGDFQALGFLSDFIFGKRTEKLEVTNKNAPQVVVMLPPKNVKQDSD